MLFENESWLYFHTVKHLFPFQITALHCFVFFVSWYDTCLQIIFQSKTTLTPNFTSNQVDLLGFKSRQHTATI